MLSLCVLGKTAPVDILLVQQTYEQMLENGNVYINI